MVKPEVRERETIDPITVATIWHFFQTLCRQMRHQLERTAQSYLMAQLKDVSVGTWLADGSTVAMPEGLLDQFLGSRFAIESMLEKFKGNLKPGDVILTNDPYHGGHNVHLPDWGFMRPIFYKDELLFFTLARGHQMDTGGSFPGGYFPNGYDIHSEGLCIPPIKVIEEGKEREDVLELIWNNVRFADGVKIDNYSMIAATKMAEDRIIGLLDKYGKDTVLGCVSEMMDRTERAVRNEIRGLKDGVYSGEAATDDDGTTLDEPVWIRVDITIDGDEMIIDLSRSDAQRKGFVNSIYASTYGRCVGAAILLFDPALADFHNEGSLRPMTVIAPLGSVVNAEYPATVGASPVNMGQQTVGAIVEALGKANPNRALADWGKHRGEYTSATDPRTGQPYVRTTFDYDGSAGAVWGYDGPTGPCALGTLASVTRGNVEEVEIRYPWRMLKLEVATDLMGAGRWRGGGGINWEALNEGTGGIMATGSSDGDVMLAKGALGGMPSPASRSHLLRGKERIRVKPHRMVPFQPGDILAKQSGGGGGVGLPWERDPEAVRKDLRDEFVSLEGAREIYKVVLDPETLEIDHEETAKLREAAAKQPWDPDTFDVSKLESLAHLRSTESE